MSQAQQNQIDELRNDVNKLIRQMQELTALLKPASPEIIQPKRRGRPPNIGHIQP